MTARPGTQFFAPQVRLIDAELDRVVGQASDNQLEGRDKRLVANPADVDLVSARVTLTCSGVSQFQVVLNNQRNKQGRVEFPPWKYNDLSQIKFGQRLRLDMRYGAEPWTKMILGRVTDLQFSFPQSGGSQLTVIGEDLLSVFKAHDENDKQYTDNTEDEIVESVIGRSKVRGLQFTGTDADPDDPLHKALVDWPDLEPLHSITHRKSTSYLQFLQDLAERMDFEMFVDFTERTVSEGAANANDVMLHFEPARSLAPPSSVVDLAWGRNLIEFTPKFKVWEQLTKVKAGGSTPGTRRRVEEELGREQLAEITADLPSDGDYAVVLPGKTAGSLNFISDDVELLDAIEVRKRYFRNEAADADNTESVDTANLDAARAKLKAIATLRKRARELLTAQGSTIGFPALRPGMYVRIDGLYPPFDGFYYVTQTVHTLDNSGYRTQFSLRRPGMLDPAKYPKGQTEGDSI